MVVCGCVESLELSRGEAAGTVVERCLVLLLSLVISLIINLTFCWACSCLGVKSAEDSTVSALLPALSVGWLCISVTVSERGRVTSAHEGGTVLVLVPAASNRVNENVP